MASTARGRMSSLVTAWPLFGLRTAASRLQFFDQSSTVYGNRRVSMEASTTTRMANGVHNTDSMVQAP